MEKHKIEDLNKFPNEVKTAVACLMIANELIQIKKILDTTTIKSFKSKGT